MQNKEPKKRCTHKAISPSFLKKNSEYTFCYNCGIVIIITQAKKQFLSKPMSMEKKSEMDPFDLIEFMHINNTDIAEDTREPSIWYIKARKKVVAYLQKLSLNLKFSDSTFYIALNYIDFLLKANEQEMKTKKLDMIVIACFVLAAKFSENDIFEPEFTQFESSNGKTIFNINDLLLTEITIIRKLKYKLNYHSVYDWLFLLFNNGFIFENELLGKPENFINQVYANTKKSLAIITSSNIFLEFDPFYIALALIDITRNNFHLDNNLFESVKKLYKIKDAQYYEDCFLEVQGTILDTNELRGTRESIVAKDDPNRKMSVANPLPIMALNHNQIQNLPQGHGHSLFKNQTTNITVTTANTEDILIPPTPKSIRGRKVFNTVKEENRIDLNTVSVGRSDIRKNSFINKVGIIRNENGEILPQSKLMSKPYCGSFVNVERKESMFASVEYHHSSQNVKMKSSVELPQPLVSSAKKSTSTAKKPSFRTDTKLPFIQSLNKP